MKIKKLSVERFRQFKKTTFLFSDINVLVGPNNSGKTTVLHAIRAFFLLMKGHVSMEGKSPSPTYHRRFISSIESIVPTPDLRELWFEQQAGKAAVKITVTFDDDMSFSVVLRQQFGQVHASSENLPEKLTTESISQHLDTDVAFIPGLVGVLVNEPYATTARRNSLATEGRYSEIFRSSLQQLNTKDSTLLDQINGTLDDLFGIRVTEVSFNQEADEYVTVKYTQGKKQYDVVSCGSGLQQVIQMLTYLYLSRPTIVLIDEPDAHLHSRLQGALGRLFRRLAADLGTQVFLSTHSMDLIDTFDMDQVIIIDASKEIHEPVGKDVDLVSCLVDSGIVDVSAVSRVLSSQQLVIVEDKDLSILKAFDRALASPLFSSSSSSFVKPAEGVGNFRNLAELGKVLESIVSGDFQLTFVQDRDGLPDFLESPFLKSQKGVGVTARLLDRHEIESYLIEPVLISAAASLSGHDLPTDSVVKTITKCGNDLKAIARGKSRDSARQVNRFLGTGNRLRDSELEVKVDQWFDNLDATSSDTVVKVWPGKELLQAVLKEINKRNGIQITRGKLVAALKKDHVAKDLELLLRDLGGETESPVGKHAPTKASRRRPAGRA